MERLLRRRIEFKIERGGKAFCLVLTMHRRLAPVARSRIRLLNNYYAREIRGDFIPTDLPIYLL